MTKIIECVPNFSEGKDERIISAIVDAIKNTPGCTVLDVDSGIFIYIYKINIYKKNVYLFVFRKINK